MPLHDVVFALLRESGNPVFHCGEQVERVRDEQDRVVFERDRVV